MAAQIQRALHRKAIKHLAELEQVIDELKCAGPHSEDGMNALLNTKERLAGLVQRCGNPAASR